MRHIVLFEDYRWPAYLPLSATRPACLLRTGPLRPIDLVMRDNPDEAEFQVWCRPQLASVVALETGLPVNEPLPDGVPVILRNGAAITKGAAGLSHRITKTMTLAADGSLVTWNVPLEERAGLSPTSFLNRDLLGKRIAEYQNKKLETPIELPTTCMDHVFAAGDRIREQFGRRGPARDGDIHASAAVVGDAKGLRVEESATVGPYVTLDVSDGPIWIAGGAKIGAGSVIIGPCYVGPKTTVHPLTRLRGNVILGPVCKVGGELEDCILQGFSNKQHDGFLGHSFLGEWVNLGAGTITSDLKNTYSPVVPALPSESWLGNEPAAYPFAGSLIGDHAKTAIGCLLTCGTVVGVGSNVLSTRPPKSIGSFRWVTEDSDEAADIEKVMGTMEKVMKRRGREFGEEYRAMMVKIAEG